MIHKFISNDNQGNVNTLEIGSDYTKISKVVDPVNDDDVANKKYVDQAGGGGLLVTLTYPTQNEWVCDKTAKEMWDVAQNGGAVVFKHTYNNGMSLYPLTQAENTSDGHYGFMMTTGEYFEADSDSEYPTFVRT